MASDLAASGSLIFFLGRIQAGIMSSVTFALKLFIDLSLEVKASLGTRCLHLLIVLKVSIIQYRVY